MQPPDRSHVGPYRRIGDGERQSDHIQDDPRRVLFTDTESQTRNADGKSGQGKTHITRLQIPRTSAVVLLFCSDDIFFLPVLPNALFPYEPPLNAKPRSLGRDNRCAVFPPRTQSFSLPATSADLGIIPF